MLPTLLRRKAVLGGPPAGPASRGGVGTEAGRGRAQTGRSPRAPADPERPGSRDARRAGILVGSSEPSASPEPPASLPSSGSSQTDVGLSVAPPRPSFLRQPRGGLPGFLTASNLSNTELLMVANQRPAGPAGSR